MAIISTATSGLAFGKTPIRVSFDLQTSTLTPNETNNRVVVCTVTTENIRNGEVLYYTITGVDITAEDFEDGLTGNFTINNNGGEFTLTVSTDLLTEGNDLYRKIIFCAVVMYISKRIYLKLLMYNVVKKI